MGGWKTLAAATKSDVEKYAEICTVAVTHVPAGRGGNEAEITETVLGSLRRVGYQTAEHPFYGFGAATGMPEVPLDAVITIVERLSRWISERRETKRQRQIDALLPQCFIQLVVTANDGTSYEPRNLAAELIAALPAVLADLQAADYRRRYTFKIYSSTTEYVQVEMQLSEDTMSNKDLLKVVRACAKKPVDKHGPTETTLSLWFVKKRWIPKKLKRSVSPANTGLTLIGGRGPRYH